MPPTHRHPANDASRGPRTFGITVALFLIRAYQQFLAPLMPLGCRFYPTCSHYTCAAIEQRGVARGILFGVRRILRCHPFSPGGFDPVPDAVAGRGECRSHTPREAAAR